MRPISNLNSVSIRNYGPNYETLAVIRELKKLGIIKSVAKGKRQSKSKMVEEVKQPSDMVGYVKTLRGAPNQLLLPMITPGMTQQQIEDIQQRSNTALLALRGEVQQQRLADIESQQGQRFEDITKLSTIINPLLERFRGAQEPGAGQRPNPFVTVSEPILLPDVGEEEFTQTLNEGGPEAVSQLPTSIFPEEEEELTPIRPQLQPREKVGGGKKKLVLDEQDVADTLGLGKIPTMRNTYTAIENFYIALTDATGDDRDVSLNSKSLILADIKKILNQKGGELLE